MQAVSLPAQAGLQWIISGWTLFKRQPMALFTWAMFITLVLIFSTLTAPFGPLLFIALMPTVTFLTLSITREVYQGTRLLPTMWFSSLKQPGLFKKLFLVGLLYVGMCLGVGLLVFLPFSGQIGQAMQIAAETQDMAPLMQVVRTPMFIFAFFYFLLAALFWYSPALIGWHGTTIGKALFFSAIACWRNRWAFILYGASWFAVFYLMDIFISAVIAIGIPAEFAAALQLPLNVVLGSVLYASFYPTYMQVFESSQTA